jgi:hypothetical protein
VKITDGTVQFSPVVLGILRLRSNVNRTIVSYFTGTRYFKA